MDLTLLGLSWVTKQAKLDKRKSELASLDSAEPLIIVLLKDITTCM